MARRGRGNLLALAAAAGLALLLCSGVQAFVGAAPRAAVRGVARAAEGESVALIKVTEENKVTTAGVLGGTAGLLLGGMWIAVPFFAVSSYVARRPDDDLAIALRGIANASLETLNFFHTLDKKYSVTDSLGNSLAEAVEEGKKNPDTKEAYGFLGTVGEAIQTFDKDVGIKNTLGSLVTAAGDLSNRIVEKLIEVNDQYKITDQLKAKLDEVSKA